MSLYIVNMKFVLCIFIYFFTSLQCTVAVDLNLGQDGALLPSEVAEATVYLKDLP